MKGALIAALLCLLAACGGGGDAGPGEQQQQPSAIPALNNVPEPGSWTLQTGK
jgi:hypothetical protein